MPGDVPTWTRPATGRESTGLWFRDAIALLMASALVVLLSGSDWLGRVGARRNRSFATRDQLGRPSRSGPISQPEVREGGPPDGRAGGGRPPGINGPGAWRHAQFRSPNPHAPDELHASWPLRRGAV